MTIKTLLKVSSLLLVLAAGFVACTSDEERHAQERQERIQKQEEADAKQKADDAQVAKEKAEQEAREAQAAATPEPPAEPEKKTVYHFTSNTEKQTVRCEEDGAIEPCGVRFESCEGGIEYYCQTGLKEWTTEE